MPRKKGERPAKKETVPPTPPLDEPETIPAVVKAVFDFPGLVFGPDDTEEDINRKIAEALIPHT